MTWTGPITGIIFWRMYRIWHKSYTHSACTVHCPKKVYRLIVDNNFGKCGPIFKILSPTNLRENSLCIHTRGVVPLRHVPPSIATVVLIGLYFLKCTRFDQLILRKIIKIVATRCQILTLICTKIDFGWGSAPDPAGGAYSAPPDPLAGFKGAYF